MRGIVPNTCANGSIIGAMERQYAGDEVRIPMDQQHTASSTATTNKTLAARWVAAINDDDGAALAGIVDEQFTDHHPLPEQDAGLLGLTHAYTRLRSAFPDWQIDVHHMFAEGDAVVVHSTWRGTHNGEFLSVPPTGTQFTVSAVDLFRCSNNKIVERWGVVDLFNILQQLAILPPMGLAGGSTRLD